MQSGRLLVHLQQASRLHRRECFRCGRLRLRRRCCAQARRHALQRRLAVLQRRALTRLQRACAHDSACRCQHAAPRAAGRRISAAHSSARVAPARCKRRIMAARPRSCERSVRDAQTVACSPRPQRSTSRPVRALKYFTAAPVSGFRDRGVAGQSGGTRCRGGSARLAAKRARRRAQRRQSSAADSRGWRPAAPTRLSSAHASAQRSRYGKQQQGMMMRCGAHPACRPRGRRATAAPAAGSCRGRGAPASALRCRRRCEGDAPVLEPHHAQRSAATPHRVI